MKAREETLRIQKCWRPASTVRLGEQTFGEPEQIRIILEYSVQSQSQSNKIPECPDNLSPSQPFPPMVSSQPIHSGVHDGNYRADLYFPRLCSSIRLSCWLGNGALLLTPPPPPPSEPPFAGPPIPGRPDPAACDIGGGGNPGGG